VPTETIQTRRVHYLPGFDPRGARHYHHLYQTQSALQTRHNHAQLSVSHRIPLPPHFHRWEIKAQWGQTTTLTDYHFLGWEDIIRQNWTHNHLAVLSQAVPAYLRFAAARGFQKVRSHSRNAFLTGTLPVAYYAATSTLALSLGRSLALALPDLPSVPPSILTPLLASLLAPAILAGGSKLGLAWLLRTYSLIHRWHTLQIPELAHRASAMAEHILASHQTNPTDETLLIGHSVGSLLAVSVAAQLQRLLTSKNLQPPPRLHLLTLGQCIPLLSFLPATLFRSELETVSNATLPWTDISAPPDPLCFFKQNPLTASNIPGASPNRVRCLNARVFRMFTPETYKKLRWNKIRLHFQYLMASELPAPYDYFRITAGPSPLSELHLPED
jgi:hypothetical protein